MLKTNSKKARENVRAYILEDADYITEYAAFYGREPETPAAVLAYAWEIFQEEKGGEMENARQRGRMVSEYQFFKDWAQGLALGGLFLYWYNRPAVDDLGEILEETDAEKARYSEDAACELLTRLIFRELEQAGKGARA